MSVNFDKEVTNNVVFCLHACLYSIIFIFEPAREKTNNLVPTRSDTNRAVQAQKMTRDMKF